MRAARPAHFRALDRESGSGHGRGERVELCRRTVLAVHHDDADGFGPRRRGKKMQPVTRKISLRSIDNSLPLHGHYSLRLRSFSGWRGRPRRQLRRMVLQLLLASTSCAVIAARGRATMPECSPSEAAALLNSGPLLLFAAQHVKSLDPISASPSPRRAPPKRATPGRRKSRNGFGPLMRSSVKR